jgi:FSR family fosmidomycin resistance protein-like MFS transporter
MAMSTSTSAWKRTGILFLGHAVNDSYGNFLAPLLPLLIQRLDLSLAMAGLLGTVYILTNSLAQPGLGLLVDRAQRPLLVTLGPLLTVPAMSLIGPVRSLGWLLALMVIAGLGTALFHPAAASLVGTGSGRNRGLLMAFFSSGGTIGAAIAAPLVIAFVERRGLERTPWLILPGLVGVAIVAASLAFSRTGYRVSRPQTEGSARPKLERLPPRLILLWFVIALRALAATAFSSFLAVLITARGGSTLAGGAGITVFLVGGALGEFLGGSLSDRFGRKAVLFGAAVLAAPCFLLVLYGPSVLLFPFLAAAGLFVFSSNPVGTVAAQECLPGQTGLASGLMMGLAWGVGGLALAPIGRFADLHGLVPVMTGVACLPLLAGILVLFFREGRPAPDR